MIQVGQEKYVLKKSKMTNASAENLPVDDNLFERATMSFGLRNITNRKKSLHEILRILKPGGRFICLEFNRVENDIFRRLYDFWSFNIVPEIGRKITGNKEAYTYLVESIRKFQNRYELFDVC